MEKVLIENLRYVNFYFFAFFVSQTCFCLVTFKIIVLPFFSFIKDLPVGIIKSIEREIVIGSF